MYIQLTDKTSIKAEEIEAIQHFVDPKDLRIVSKVYTSNSEYASYIPRKALIQIIEMKESEEPSIERQQLNIMKQEGTFAG